MIKFLHRKPFWHLLFVCIFISFVNLPIYSQTTFWTETFSNGCSASCTSYTGPNGAWNMNVSTGANSATCNLWYVSCAEDGQTIGSCGTACTINDPSLHIGSQSLGDIGGSFDASEQTHYRSESPNINTTPAGGNAITLSFACITYGEVGSDYSQLLYSVNGGTSWAFLANPIATTLCCGGACNSQRQGRWATRSYVLPGTCNNIANFKIAFNWINDADATGNDPSIAVDDIILQYTAPMPVSWLSFEGYRSNSNIFLNWKTASEINNDYFEVQRSMDGLSYSAVGKVKGSGNSNEIKSYSLTDNNIYHGTSYYKIKQVDYNGTSQFSKTISVSFDESTDEIFSLQMNLVQSTLTAIINSSFQNSCYMEIKDVLGKKIISQILDVSKGDNNFQYNISSYKSGVYFFILKDKSNQKVVASSKFVKL